MKLAYEDSIFGVLRIFFVGFSNGWNIIVLMDRIDSSEQLNMTY